MHQTLTGIWSLRLSGKVKVSVSLDGSVRSDQRFTQVFTSSSENQNTLLIPEQKLRPSLCFYQELNRFIQSHQAAVMKVFCRNTNVPKVK